MTTYTWGCNQANVTPFPHDIANMKEQQYAELFTKTTTGEFRQNTGLSDASTDIDDTNEDEAKLYELEDGKLEMVLDGTRYSLSEIQADVDLDAGTVTMDLEDVTSE